MPPSLLDLPTEILTTIFSYNLLKCTYIHYAGSAETRVWTKQRDLHALCLTNRRISTVAQGILLEDVRFDLRDEHENFIPRPGNDWCDCETVRDRASLFLRSHLENPHLQHHIRRVEVSVNKKFLIYHDVERVEADIMEDYGQHSQMVDQMLTHARCFLSALSLSSSLISLKLDFTGCCPDENPLFNLTGFPADCFSALKSLGIHARGDTPVPVDFLLRWCTLPQLKHLTVSAWIHGKKSSVSTGPYRIESLEVIDQHLYIAHKDLLRSVIPEFRFLTTLDLPMVGCKYKRLCAEDLWATIFLDNNFEGIFSPREIGYSLAPMAHSLRHLSIVSAEHITFRQHDDSVLDLSRFKHLRKIRLSAYFFMCWRNQYNTPDVLYCLQENLVEVLPASLQEFEIILNGDHGLFYGHLDLESILIEENGLKGGQEEAEELFSNMWRGKMKSEAFVLRHLRWITDLLASQPVRLPELTRVLVSEGTSPRPFVYSDLAAQFPQLIEGSGVNVQVLQKIAGQCRASDLPDFCPPTASHGVISEQDSHFSTQD